MGMTIKVTDNRQEAKSIMRKSQKKAMFAATLHVQTKIKDILTGSRGGRIYRKPGTKHVKYQASSPGEAPATVWGGLRRAIKRQLILKPWLIGEIGVPDKTRKAKGNKKSVNQGDVAIWLERGTRKVEPRPFFSKGFQKAKDQVINIMRRPWI